VKYFKALGYRMLGQSSLYNQHTHVFLDATEGWCYMDHGEYYSLEMVMN
jgi:hypothetical protein